MVSNAVTGEMHWHVTLCTTLRVRASYRCFSRFSGLQRHDNSLTKGQQLLYFVVLQNYHLYLRPPVSDTIWLQSMRFVLVSVGSLPRLDASHRRETNSGTWQLHDRGGGVGCLNVITRAKSVQLV
jgi:hypothetical protein